MSQSNTVEHLTTIAGNAGLGIVGKVYFILSRFVLVIFITRTIGPEQYGLYMLGWSSIQVIGVFGIFGIGQAMVRFVAHHLARQEEGHVKGIIDFGTKVATASGVLIASGIFLLADPIAVKIFGKPELAAVLRIMSLALPFMKLMQLFLSALQGAKLVKYRILIEHLLRPTIRFLVIAVAFAIGLRLMGVVLAWVTASFIAFLLSGYFLMRELRKFKQDKVVVKGKTVLKFSLPLWMSDVIIKNNRNIGVLLIGIFLSADQAGIYSVAMRMMPFILIPFMAYNNIFSPIISGLYANDKLGELEVLYKIGSRWVLVLTLPVFVLIVFFSKDIISIFGQGFSASHEVLMILLVAQMVNVSTGSAMFMLTMTGKPIYNLINSGIIFLLNIILCVVLINKFGAIGAAYALGISIASVQVLQLAEVYYLYRFHPFSLAHLKPIVGCFFSMVIIFILKASLIFLPPYLLAALLGVVFSISYLLFLVLLGISQEDRAILQNIANNLRSLLLKRSNHNEKHSIVPEAQIK
jgi:O-antigen/teichoic acid export membrane protein